MNTLKQINTHFYDTNGDDVVVKIATKPFINGGIDDVVNWMVQYQYANVNMEDSDTGDTFFFLACLNNPNDDLIKWLIETGEVDLNYENYHGENVIDYLCVNSFNSEFIENRIKILLDYHTFDFNKVNYKGESKFEHICITGNYNIVKHLVEKKLVNPNLNMFLTIQQKLSTIINDHLNISTNLNKYCEGLQLINNYLRMQSKRFIYNSKIVF